MNKLFRPKCLRRVLLCLALLFPVVYLCGGLFFALAGAHGENVLATEETSIIDYKSYDFNQLKYNGNLEEGSNGFRVWNTSYVEQIYNSNIPSLTYSITDISSTETYQYSAVVNVPNAIIGHVYIVRLNLYSNSFSQFRLDNWGNYNQYNLTDGFYWFRWIANNNSASVFITPRSSTLSVGDSFTLYSFQLFDLSQMYGFGNEPTYDEFINDFPDPYYDYTLSQFVSIPVYGVPNEQNSLFFHVFGQRNFISQLGKDLVNGSTKGFNPMNELFRSINSNIMNFDDSDSLAMFGLGYVYYAVNVLIVYEVLILAVKLIMLPLRVVELFDKKEDI